MSTKKGSKYLNKINDLIGYDDDLINDQLLEKIFSQSFIRENFKRYNEYKKIKNDNFFKFILNPTLDQINLNKNNNIFIFTYDFFLNLGIYPKFSEEYFSTNIFKTLRKKGIEKINNNINKLKEYSSEIGFSVSTSGLSIFYYKIKDFKVFLLENQLDGPTNEFNSNEIYDSISTTMSQMTNNTSSMVGHIFEENVLIYILKNANLKSNQIFPRVFLYLNYIILNISYKSRINFEFVPFNILGDKIEGYNEVDLSFCIDKNITIPLTNDLLKYNLFNYTINVPKNDTKTIIFKENELNFFEIKNEMTNTKDDITYKKFLGEIKSFAGKIPLFCEIYKIKNFIDYEQCKGINLFYIYNQKYISFNDNEKMREELSKILNDTIKLNIKITLNVLYCSKQIQSINYFNLFYDNMKMKNELNKTKNELNNKINNLQNLIKNICIKNNIQIPEILFDESNKFNESNESNNSQEEKKLEISLIEDEEENKKFDIELNETEKLIFNNIIKDKEIKKITKEEKNINSIYDLLKKKIKKEKYKKYDLNIKKKLVEFLKAKLNKK